jgi:pyruvate,water dikinase
MASLCREYHVPTLLDVKSATTQLQPGMIVTVDAWAGRVYQGRVEELLDRTHSQASFMRETPVGQTLAQASRLMVPLKLVNPRSPEFKPEACASIHDIMRFVHEASYAAMFKISDLLTESEGGAVKLRARVPLDLYVIDLGGGIVDTPASTKEVQVEEISSSPFAALLKGMLHPDLQLTGPRPIELRGLFSVMGQQMFTPPNSGGERFGDRSYAIISDRYLHFSSRIGYHYSILDAYCDQMVRKNYITFSFQGGAADEVRRGRRARAIMEILKASAFSVRSRADRVDARIRRVERPTLLDNLEMLGKILQFTRQLDMLMHSEESVGQVSKAFLEGRYRLISDT